MRGVARTFICMILAAVMLLAHPWPAAAQTAETAPPARVGQIARLDGPVSFIATGSAAWIAATPNYPLTTGDALYTQGSSAAAMTIGWSRIELDGGTELQIARLDEQRANLVLPQGEMFLDLRYMAPGEIYTVETPRGTVTISRNGRYAIRAGDAATPTLVSVVEGDAQLQGDGIALRVGPRETAILSGANPVIATLGVLATDTFIERMLARPVPPAPSIAPLELTGMTGAAMLSAYGTWSDVPAYGAIWYPRVAVSWAPYRHGHWAYVAPWGWTWIDDDPWGFAPFHYGRWIRERGRWGWLPAPIRAAGPGYISPIYAPALVSFFDVGAGVSIGIGLTSGALAGGAIGWVPLAPDEPYLPWYRSSPVYVERLNRLDVRDPGRWREIDPRRFAAEHHPNRFANRIAATVIGAEAMRRGDPVGRFGHPAPGTALAAARPMVPVRAGTPHPAFGRLPAGPGAQAPHRPAAAPRPAPFAASRGMPVRRPDTRSPARLTPGTRPVTPPRAAIPDVAHRPATPRPPVAPKGPIRPQAVSPPAHIPQVRDRGNAPPAQGRPNPQTPRPAPPPQARPQPQFQPRSRPEISRSPQQQRQPQTNVQQRPTPGFQPRPQPRPPQQPQARHPTPQRQPAPHQAPRSNQERKNQNERQLH